MQMRVPDSLQPFQLYWRVYGGWKALATSPYLVVAIILTVLCYSFWSFPGTDPAQLAIDVVPSVMAFSLGGMAIVLAFSDGSFLRAIRQGGNEKSLFMKVMATFFHFLILQTLALVLAVVVLTFPDPIWLSGVAFFFFAYSLTTSLAAAAALFNVSRIYNMVGGDDDPA